MAIYSDKQAMEDRQNAMKWRVERRKERESLKKRKNKRKFDGKK